MSQTFKQAAVEQTVNTEAGVFCQGAQQFFSSIITP